MENIASYNVARKYEKRALLILVNCVAGLSIFFFGYDQGVMGGVNGNRNYASIMGFGAFDDATGIVAIFHPLLQGGIVSTSSLELPSIFYACHSADMYGFRSLSTISLAPSLAHSSEAGSVIDTVVLRP